MKKNPDPFLKLVRSAVLASPDLGRRTKAGPGHAERAHSKFSASGAERWFRCPGSVALSEGLPDKPSIWALEGTEAHEVLEKVLVNGIRDGMFFYEGSLSEPGRKDMYRHALEAARFILKRRDQTPGSDVLVETRVYLDFIHPEMFGTFDGAVIDHFGTLDVFDYKYGAGHAVSPVENLQMIFYGIGLAHQFGWNFKRIRLWIIQPRVKGYDGPLFWELRPEELRAYVPQFREAAERAIREPEKFEEGGHCHWCKAKSICPLKREAKLEEARSVFGIPARAPTPQMELLNLKSEAEWRKEARGKKGGPRKKKKTS